MLVLTRRKNESLLIGDDIVVTIVRVSGDKVRIGIEAPDSVRVIRPEAVEKERREDDDRPTTKRD